MIIHKRRLNRYIIAEESLCNRWVQHSQTSFQWRRVTCKNCLKKEEKK